MINNDHELSIEVGMLQGSINRMCLTDDWEELVRQTMSARRRLDDIQIYTMNRFQEKNKEEENEKYESLESKSKR